MSKRSMVKTTVDGNRLPPLTAVQRRRLKKLAKLPDSKIDYRDIPPLTGREKWTRPGALIAAENKQSVTLRLDADVLKYFKQTGRRYQTRINAVLREYVAAQR